jgi:predicted RNase H-like HicB family nuclease
MTLYIPVRAPRLFRDMERTWVCTFSTRSRLKRRNDMLLYPATIRLAGDTFVVLFPDIPHTHTNGKSREDALLHARDALQPGIFALMEKNLDIPLPSKPRNMRFL